MMAIQLIDIKREEEQYDTEIEDDGPYIGSGWAYYNKGEYDKAITEYTEAIHIYPYNTAYCLRGMAYMKNQEYDNAIADYSETINLDPNNFAYVHHSYKDRAKAYEELKQYNEAIADYEEMLKRWPSDDECKANIERIKALLKTKEE